MNTEIRISLDPGMTTGVCVWEQNKPRAFELTPKKRDRWEVRNTYLCKQLGDLLEQEFPGRRVAEVAIERNSARNPVERGPSIHKLWYATGQLHGFFESRGVPVVAVNTGNPKVTSCLVAKTFGVRSNSTHIQDAILVGWLAKFHER